MTTDEKEDQSGSWALPSAAAATGLAGLAALTPVGKPLRRAIGGITGADVSAAARKVNELIGVGPRVSNMRTAMAGQREANAMARETANARRAQTGRQEIVEDSFADMPNLAKETLAGARGLAANPKANARRLAEISGLKEAPEIMESLLRRRAFDQASRQYKVPPEAAEPFATVAEALKGTAERRDKNGFAKGTPLERKKAFSSATSGLEKMGVKIDMDKIRDLRFAYSHFVKTAPELANSPDLLKAWILESAAKRS